MSAGDESKVSQLTLYLNGWKAGDPAAASLAITHVYDRLKRMAAAQLRKEPRGVLIQPAELVHDLYLRLEEAAEIRFQNRAHFFAIAARTLRRVLHDKARQRRTEKRGGETIFVSIEALDSVTGPHLPLDYLDLDKALSVLDEFNPRAAAVVEMRFFSEMSEDEIAEVLGVNRKTVARSWKWARLWLRRYLRISTDEKIPPENGSSED